MTRGPHPSPLNVLDVLRVLFRHAKLVLGSFSLIVVAGIVAVVIWPRTYQSDAALLVQVGRSSISVDPSAVTGNQPVSMNVSREREINTVMQILQTRTLLEQVVDQLGPNAVLQGGDAGPISMADMTAEKRENAIKKLRDAVHVSVGRGSNVIDISAESASPEFAQHILSTYLNAFQKQHIEVHHTSGSFEFFDAEAARAKKELEETNDRLADLKQKLGLVSIAGRRSILETQINELNRQLLDTETGLATVRTKLRSIRQSDPGVEPEESSNKVSDQALDDMRVQLYELQIREREFSSKYTADHPQVVALREQVKQSQRLLNRQEYAIAVARESELAEKMESLKQRHAEATATLLALSDQDKELKSLERQVQFLTRNYQQLDDKREQARMGQEMNAKHISNIKVAQEPTLIVEPASPRVGTILCLALVGSIFGSAALAFGAEMIDDTLQTPDQVEQTLGLPVLLTVPHLANNKPLAR